ncbi:MAG TPA: mechanosensitive ion channel domain-containing protein [Rhizobacter sp.]|nr:mechanosensitive ion channel domain-containing protein [Rhizobacter sp.]
MATACSTQLWRRLACALGLAAALLAPAQAQLLSKALPAAPAASRESAPIVASDILNRADEDRRVVERANRKARGRDPGERLAARLDEIARPVDQKLRTFQADELRRLPVMRLESLDRHWLFDARRLERWEVDLRQTVAPYTDDLAGLARRRAAWEATRAAIGPDRVPAAMSGAVDTMISELRAAEDGLSVPLSRLIELGHRADALGARIQAGRNAVASAIEHIDRRLLRLDVPPLWAAQPQPAGRSDEAMSLERGLEIESQFAREYAAVDVTNLHVLRFVQLLLLPLLVWLALRHRRQAAAAGNSPPADDTTARVLRRPIASWVLLSMIAVLVFEADAPLFVHEVALLVALVPVLRLLPPHSLRLLGVWPYVASGLYLASRLGLVVAPDGLPYRLLQLGLSLLALGVMLWLLWRSRVPAGKLTPRLRAVMRALGLGAVGLLAVAAVSNVVGNVSLAEMLTTGVIDSGYLGLLLYAGVTVSTALLRSGLAVPAVAQLRLVRYNAATLERFLRRALALGAVFGWVVYTMSRFRILRPVRAALGDALAYSVSLGELSLSLGKVLVFVLSVLLAVWVARLVRVLLRDELLGHLSLPRGVGNSVASLSYYTVLILGFVVALSAAGFQVSQFALVFGALGVGIGFGLQGVVNNFVSGLVLMFERPIQPGDIIDIAGVSGEVRDIGIRATIIRTFDGADVVVPNGSLLSGNLTNWTLLDRRRRFEIPVGVAYGSDPAQVIALLEGIARDTPGVMTQPAPSAVFRNYGASSLDFALRAWTQDYDGWVVLRSNMMTRILRELDAAGIGIPFSQHDLHLRSLSEEAAAILRPPQPPA